MTLPLDALLSARKIRAWGAWALSLSAAACVATEPDGTDDVTSAQYSDAGDSAEEPTVDDSSEAPETSCPSAQKYFEPGCGTEFNLLQAGCYQECEGEEDDSCASGTLCTAADINPCTCPGEDECCAACGQAVWLCQTPPETTECGDKSRDPIVVSASRSFGLCQGECLFELTLSAAERCDAVELVVGASGPEPEVRRTNHGVLTPLGHDLIRQRAADLGATEIEDTHGCPDCDDGGKCTVTLMRDGEESTSAYECYNAPTVLESLDVVTQALIYALQTCETNNLLEVTDCTLQSEDLLPPSEPEFRCDELDESVCAEDERCEAVHASPVDEEAQCRGPMQFAGCAPSSDTTCTALLTVARDPQNRCWYFTGNCGIPGFRYFDGTNDGDCRWDVPMCGAVEGE